MRRIHIIGRKNSGKTTLVTDLVRELKLQGLVVGTIKHTHHQHELDTPGKDSHRHRTAGADVVGILTPTLDAVFSVAHCEHDDPLRYERMAPSFAGCDIVLVEGQTHTPAPRIEVWREATGTRPLACSDSGIRAVVTDDPISVPVPVLPRSDVNALAQRVLRWAVDVAGSTEGAG